MIVGRRCRYSLERVELNCKEDVNDWQPTERLYCCATSSVGRYGKPVRKTRLHKTTDAQSHLFITIPGTIARQFLDDCTAPVGKKFFMFVLVS